MKISRDEAKEYFADPSQRKGLLKTPDDLPDSEDIQYWAKDGVCGVFHVATWPGVWMGHYAVKPEVRGKATEPAKALLRAFWENTDPQLIIGWTSADNRAALAFAKRLGFRIHGEMNMPQGKVIEQSWRPEWA